jgi:hypothetical protein
MTATPVVSGPLAPQGPIPAYQGQKAVDEFRLIRNDIDSTTLWVTVKRRSLGKLEIVFSGYHRRFSAGYDRNARAQICLNRQGQQHHGSIAKELLNNYVRDLNAVSSPSGIAPTAEVYGRTADAVLDCVLLDRTRFGLNASIDTSGRINATLFNFQVQRSVMGTTGPPVFGQAVENTLFSRLLHPQSVDPRFIRYALNDDEIKYRNQHSLHETTRSEVNRANVDPNPSPTIHRQKNGSAGIRAPPQSPSVAPVAAQVVKPMTSTPAVGSPPVRSQTNDVLPAWRREINRHNILEPTMALAMCRENDGRLIMTVYGFNKNQPFTGNVEHAVNTALRAQGRTAFHQPPGILCNQGTLSHWRTRMSNVAGGTMPLLAFSREASGILCALGDQHPQIRIERAASGLITLTLANVRIPEDFTNKVEWEVRKQYNNWQGRVGEGIALSLDETFWSRLQQAEDSRRQNAMAAFPVNGMASSAPVLPQEIGGIKRKPTDRGDENGQYKAQKYSINQTSGQFRNKTSNVDTAHASAIHTPAAPPSYFANPAATAPPMPDIRGLKRKSAELSDQDTASKVSKKLENQTPAQAYHEDSIQAKQCNVDAALTPHTAPSVQPSSVPHTSPSNATQANKDLDRRVPDDFGRKLPDTQTLKPAETADETVDTLPEIVDDDLFGDGDLGDDLFGDGNTLPGDVDDGSQAKPQDTMAPAGLALPQPSRVYAGLALPRMTAQAQAVAPPPPITNTHKPIAGEMGMDRPAVPPPATHKPFSFNSTSTTVSPERLKEAEERTQKAQNQAAYENYCAECKAKGVSPELKVAERILSTGAPRSPKKAKDDSRPTLAAMIKWCAGGQLTKGAPKVAELRAFLKAGPKDWKTGYYGKGFTKVELQERIHDLWSNGTLRRHMDLPDGSIVEDPTKSTTSTGGNASSGGNAQPKYGIQTASQSYAPLGQAKYAPQTPMAMPGYGQVALPQQPLPYGASYASDYGVSLTPSNMPPRIVQATQLPVTINESDEAPVVPSTATPPPAKKPRKSRAKAITISDSAPNSPPAKKSRSKKKKIPIHEQHGFKSAEEFDAYQAFLLKNNGALGSDGNEVDPDKDEMLNEMAREAARKVAPRPAEAEMQRRDSAVAGMGIDQAFDEED